MHAYTKLLILTALVLSLPCIAQEPPALPASRTPDTVQLPGGITSAQEYHAYIIGLYSRNFYDLAAEQAAKFEQCFPKHALSEELMRVRIESLYALRHHQEAADTIQLYLKNYPKSARREELLSRAAASLYELKRFDEAAANYQQLLKAKDANLAEAAEYFLAQCLLATGKGDEANVHLESLAGKEQTAKHLYRLYAKQFLAAQKFQKGNYTEALADYRALLNVPELPKELRRELLLPAADICQTMLRDFKAAAEYYGAFTVEFGTDPRSQYARRSMLQCFFRLENYQQFARSATDYLRDYPKAVSEDPDLLIMNASALQQLQKYQEALEYLKLLDACGKATPQHRQFSASSKVLCLAKIQDFEGTIAAVEAYLAQYPAANDKVEILVQGGSAAEQLQRTDNAIDYYRQALALATADTAQYQQIGIYLAQYYARNNRWSDAAALYENLAQHTEDTAQQSARLLTAADAWYRAQDYAKAERLARAVLATPELSLTERRSALSIAYASALVSGQYPSAASDAAALANLSITTNAEKADWMEKAGSAHIGAKNYEAAIQCFSAVADNPDLSAAKRPATLLRLLELLLFEKKHDAAMERGAQLLLQPQSPYDALPYARILQNLALVCSEPRPDIAQAAWRTVLAQPGCDTRLRIACMEKLCESHLAKEPGESTKYIQQLSELTRDSNGTSQLPPTAASVAAELALQQKLYSKALQEANSVLSSKANPPLRALARARWVKAMVLYEYDHDLHGALSLATVGFVISQRADDIYTPRSQKLAAEILRQQGLDKQAEEILSE